MLKPLPADHLGNPVVLFRRTLQGFPSRGDVVEEIFNLKASRLSFVMSSVTAQAQGDVNLGCSSNHHNSGVAVS